VEVREMQKANDHSGRWRSLTVAFRMSPEENADLNTRVKLSGLTKQDYIIRRLSERDVVVLGNPRVHKALRNQMSEIYEELRRLERTDKVSEGFLATLQLLAITVGGMDNEAQKL